MQVTQIHQEVQSFRVVVPAGGATHPELGTIPETGCFPLPTTKTGTIDTDTATSDGVKVAGTGTLFLSELNQGDFIANAAGLIRKIKWIFSDTLLEIDYPFPADLSGAGVRHVPKSLYNSIVAESNGTADAELQEQAFPTGEKYFNEGAPVSYDVSTVGASIAFILSL